MWSSHAHLQAGWTTAYNASFILDSVLRGVFVLLPFILAQMFSINFPSKIRADPAELECKKVTGQRLGVVG